MFGMKNVSINKNTKQYVWRRSFRGVNETIIRCGPVATTSSRTLGFSALLALGVHSGSGKRPTHMSSNAFCRASKRL